MHPTVAQMCISETDSVRHALEVIDLNAQGICFVISKTSQFLGVVSDGDIRRALLKGLSLDTEAKQITNGKAFSLNFRSHSDVIQASFTEKIRHIPLLDDSGRVVDYACLSRLRRIPVMEPHLGGNELAYVTDCIKTGWISSKGTYVTKFEEMVGQYCGTKNAVAVSNGTVALHLALEALGIGPGDEVIVPDFTFAASINSILYTGATPVIVDIEPGTWTISVSEIEKAITPKTKAIMPVHIYGHPCDMDAIMSIAKSLLLTFRMSCLICLGSEYARLAES